jgi:hypothetical protein
MLEGSLENCGHVEERHCLLQHQLALIQW